VRDLWVARRRCNCRPFDWVRDLYEKRRQLGSDTRGYPLKLGLNSLYGKMAQRCGRGPYHDAVSAGFITAITRARLIEALAQDPKAVVMLATDAVFSTRPLALDIGGGLGQWECREWPDLFIAQPGVYWSPSNLSKLVKSRGAPRSVIGEAAPRFLEVWNEWHALLRQPGARELILAERQIPSVPVTVRVFNGCRIALHRGKPWLAGKWEDLTRHESFEWKTKRDPNRILVCDEGHIVTFPRVQSILAESEGYKPADFDRLIEISGENGSPVEIDENMLLEAMPDYTPFLRTNEPPRTRRDRAPRRGAPGLPRPRPVRRALGKRRDGGSATPQAPRLGDHQRLWPLRKQGHVARQVAAEAAGFVARLLRRTAPARVTVQCRVADLVRDGPPGTPLSLCRGRAVFSGPRQSIPICGSDFNLSPQTRRRIYRALLSHGPGRIPPGRVAFRNPKHWKSSGSRPKSERKRSRLVG
jgi:hypothetical protein